jgi:redox-sensitive bicupin YhaK (pirin superfamily)
MSEVARLIEGRSRDLGGFSVRRLLPATRLQTVGPFIFFDHMGPAVFPAGGGVDVRPHPHIGLAAVTYLYEGEFLHRDSLGTPQVIRPGDVNWMVAGRGIVHSERTSPELRGADGAARVHGIQTWVALPKADEEAEPSFAHHPADTLPEIRHGGAVLRVIAGEAWGHRAPLDGQRQIWWNFVSSSRERIERAKLDWQEERFAPVPGDDERIPLPET